MLHCFQVQFGISKIEEILKLKVEIFKRSGYLIKCDTKILNSNSFSISEFVFGFNDWNSF